MKREIKKLTPKPVDIRSKKIEMVPIETIYANPKNRNRHSAAQIDELVRIIRYQGFRVPIIVNARSERVVSGHGRLEAARILGMKQVPVIRQEFETAEQEYAAMISDNAIASWSELDLAGVNADIADLGPDLDIALLGIEGFKVDVAEHGDDAEGARELGEEQFSTMLHECPKCGFKFGKGAPDGAA